MWQGFLTQTWGDIQEEHYQKTNQEHRYTGGRWVKTVIMAILKHATRIHDDQKQEKNSAN